MYNPSLRREPIHEPAAVIPTQQQASILDWLEESGRLLARDDQEVNYIDDVEEETLDLIAVDDHHYDDSEEDTIDPMEL